MKLITEREYYTDKIQLILLDAICNKLDKLILLEHFSPRKGILCRIFQDANEKATELRNKINGYVDEYAEEAIQAALKNITNQKTFVQDNQIRKSKKILPEETK